MTPDLVEQELSVPYPSVVRLVSVKIRNRGDVKKMDAGTLSLRAGEAVIVEYEGELTFAVCESAPIAMPFTPPMRMARTILRLPTSDERGVIQRHEQLLQEGMAFCREQAAQLGLRMKMVEVFAALDRRQITFVYTADDRIDFRELVRVLARRFHCRIEMRQIGVREEARRLGGVDTCGLTLCCTSFLTDFLPVSVKQARKLGVAVDDPKLLGLCGRLKCCLMFEAMEAQQLSPKPSALITPSSDSKRPVRRGA
ncbi:MAG: regulatory iron-sulfur-containing complex subunit RicT [Nitrospiraceae bacterium]